MKLGKFGLKISKRIARIMRSSRNVATCKMYMVGGNEVEKVTSFWYYRGITSKMTLGWTVQGRYQAPYG